MPDLRRHLTQLLPVLMLLLATAVLGWAQARPRPDQPLALFFPPGVAETAALLQVLAAPGWDPIAIRRLGPFTLALVAPNTPGSAGPAPQGAWLVLPAIGRAPCAAANLALDMGRPLS
ncbi:hypothetical protein [Falsiroseomonas tokyonensis]|uniref:Uncharacterized protein n=1 Tax=Falsiroseomonas tokyonensis TaxID=430521 RepID=A0ABV7BPG0_9PROT|nr:hypothetical protein [Falsiroseomonas tokyonensis]MBU8537109.1 hypothetical protein [Falsiroseomonas tokyonensis]